MKHYATFLAFTALAVACSSAFAIDDNWGLSGQPALASGQDDCQNLKQEIDASFQRSVQARVPKEDPSTFVQNGYDVKSLLSKDVTAGLGRLTQLLGGNFSGFLTDMVNGALQQTVAQGQQNFSNRINSLLNGAGVPGMQFQQVLTSATSNVSSGISSAISPITSKVTNAAQSLASPNAPPPAPASVYSPYGTVRAR